MLPLLLRFRFEPRVLISCELCGRLMVVPPTPFPTCPDCVHRRARLLDGKTAPSTRRWPSRWERFGRVGRRATSARG